MTKVEATYPQLDGIHLSKVEKAEINREKRAVNAMLLKRFHAIMARKDAHGRNRIKGSLDRKIIPYFYFWGEMPAEHMQELIE